MFVYGGYIYYNFFFENTEIISNSKSCLYVLIQTMCITEWQNKLKIRESKYKRSKENVDLSTNEVY